MRKKSFLILLIISHSFYSLSDNNDESFNSLISQLNNYLSHYSNYTGHEYGYIELNAKKLGFTIKEIKELQKEDIELNQSKDSIEFQALLLTYQDKISNIITKLVKHEKFINSISKTLFHEELTVISSPDNKLFNFNIDEKTGGTYRSRISIMYYSETDSIYEGEFFESDGYGLIDTLQTDSGVKYLMQGSVRGCSMCFTTHISLIQFRENEFHWDFYYRFDSRDWDDDISVDSTKRKIEVSYHLNDLQETCTCESETEGELEYNMDKNILCSCVYQFNGSTFELIEKREKIIEDEEE